MAKHDRYLILRVWVACAIAYVALSLVSFAASADDVIFGSCFECKDVIDPRPTLTVTPELVTAGEPVTLAWMLPDAGMCNLTGPDLTLDDAALRASTGQEHTPTESADYELGCGSFVSASVTVNQIGPPPPLAFCEGASSGSRAPPLDWNGDRDQTDVLGEWGAASSAVDLGMGNGQYIALEFCVPANGATSTTLQWVSNPLEANTTHYAVRNCIGPPDPDAICRFYARPPGGSISMGVGSSLCPLQPNSCYVFTFAWEFTDGSSSCDKPGGRCELDVTEF